MSAKPPRLQNSLRGQTDPSAPPPPPGPCDAPKGGDGKKSKKVSGLGGQRGDACTTKRSFVETLGFARHPDRFRFDKMSYKHVSHSAVRLPHCNLQMQQTITPGIRE